MLPPIGAKTAINLGKSFNQKSNIGLKPFINTQPSLVTVLGNSLNELKPTSAKDFFKDLNKKLITFPSFLKMAGNSADLEKLEEKREQLIEAFGNILNIMGNPKHPDQGLANSAYNIVSRDLQDVEKQIDELKGNR